MLLPAEHGSISMKLKLFAIASLLILGVLPARAGDATVPVAAIGYTVCGQPLGFLLVYNDGRTERHSYDDTAALALTLPISDEHRTILRIVGAICNDPDKRT